MLFASATNFHRKSGGAKRRDLRFHGPFVEMFFDRSEPDLQFAPPATNLRWKHHLPLVIPTGAKRSGGTCGSTDPSWKCFSGSRASAVPRNLYRKRRIWRASLRRETRASDQYELFLRY